MEFVCFGIVLAVTVLVIAIFTAFPIHLGLRLQGMRPVETGVWVTAECSPQSPSASAGNTLFFTAGHQVLRWEHGDGTAFSFNGPPVLGSGGTPIGFVPGERAAMLLSSQPRWLSLPGAVDRVISGRDAFGVICSGSGYMTNTILYDLQGRELFQIGLVAEAMLQGVFFHENVGFGALSYGIDGLWRVKSFSMEGEKLWQYSFEASSAPELLGLGEHLFLVTEDELLLFDSTGGAVSAASFGVWEPYMASCGQEFLALLMRCRGAYRIMTLSPEGEVLGQWDLPDAPMDMTVSAGKIYVLDTGSLHVFDAFGNLRLSSSEGARAGKLEASETSVWLIGNGELMEIKTS